MKKPKITAAAPTIEMRTISQLRPHPKLQDFDRWMEACEIARDKCLAEFVPQRRNSAKVIEKAANFDGARNHCEICGKFIPEGGICEEHPPKAEEPPPVMVPWRRRKRSVRPIEPKPEPSGP